MKNKAYLVFFSFLLSFLFIEIIFRIFIPQDISEPWRIYLDDGLLLNKNDGVAKHSLKKANRTTKYTFGKYHNREYNLTKSENKILFLGDSFTFGWLLNDEETYVYKLGKKFSEYELINSAAGGHGTSDQLRYFEKFCNKIKPKYTFILMNAYDIERSKISNLYYLDKKNNLIYGKNNIPKINYFIDNSYLYKFLISNFHTVNFLRKIYAIIDNILSNKKPLIQNNENDKSIRLDKIDNLSDKKYILERKLFKRFKNYSLKCETEIHLINLAWENREKSLTHTYKFLRDNNKFLKKIDINYVDLHNKMKVKYKSPQTYQIEIDGHPNEKGNNLYFENLYDVLKKIIK